MGRRTSTLAALIVSVVGCGAGGTAQARGPAPRDHRASAATGAPSTSDPSMSATERDDELPPLPAPDAVPSDATGINVVPPGGNGKAGPAARYASLDRATCEAELGKRNIAFDRVGEARGVVAPLRLKGLVGGIDFHSMLPAAARRTSPYEIYDCRLVLALDDWARVLSRHDVIEVVHYSVYRPPPAKQVLNGAGRRHSGGLAIDAAIFRTRDGRTLSVEKDFHGRIGSKPCVAPTLGLPTEALTLRKIVCEAADAQLFNVMLTPDYNWPHRNHFHLEVTAGVRWTLVR